MPTWLASSDLKAKGQKTWKMYRIIRGCRGGRHRRPILPTEQQRQPQPKRPRKGIMNSYRISVLFTITVISTHTVAGKCHNWVNKFIKSHSNFICRLSLFQAVSFLYVFKKYIVWWSISSLDFTMSLLPLNTFLPMMAALILLVDIEKEHAA